MATICILHNLFSMDKRWFIFTVSVEKANQSENEMKHYLSILFKAESTLHFTQCTEWVCMQKVHKSATPFNVLFEYPFKLFHHCYVVSDRK
jgi:hypothetical protein